MTKQEEIKRMMQRKIELGVSFGFTPEQVTDEVWSFLHSQGVVIRGDRDCDNCRGTGKFTFVRTDEFGTYEGDCLKCSGMGKLGEIVAVEPLIGDSKK